MQLTLITPPAEMVVDLDTAKAHLRVDFDDDDDQITLIVKAATERAENYTARAFVTQTWDWVLDEFPGYGWHGGYWRHGLTDLRLPLAPVQTVTSVKYRDDNGDLQTFASAGYTLRPGAPAWVGLAPDGVWPSTRDAGGAVVVRFVAGYGAAAAVPAAVKHAVLYDVKNHYVGEPDRDWRQRWKDMLAGERWGSI